ncbi:dihydrofolate reductase [Hyphomonas sp. WL0036]|uniref:dihydrofolate reductase n=1 Tax=Hyphomonas sediminis TaxID=2866160 RepID=UPI001C802E3C|nr:dihydrofolate reductase [Hyphomonas sediminis]MBY9065562.1 dihydrofolate reductase [Hyphomonas sediminis]
MSIHVKLCLIVAQARNRVIGAGGALPWRLKDDMAFFKSTTMGAPVIMGRKTWESFPKRPLPGRENIVLTRDWDYDAAAARVYSSFPAAMNAARAIAAREGKDEVFVIGGAEIYNLALPFADRIYLTEVDAEVEGDTFFPVLEAREWAAQELAVHAAGETNDHAFTIRQLDRVTAPV